MTSVRIPSIKLPYVTRPSLMKALKKKKKYTFSAWQQAWTFLFQIHHKYLTLKSPTFMTHFVSRLVGTLWQRACHLPVIWKYGHIGNFLFWPSTLLSYQIINKREDWGDKLFLAHRNWRKSRELSGWSVNPILVKDQKVWQHLPACNVQFGAESMSTEARRIWAAQFMGDFRYSSAYRKRRESKMIWVRRH